METCYTVSVVWKCTVDRRQLAGQSLDMLGLGPPQLLAGRGPLWWPRGSCGQRRLQKVIKANQWEKAGP